MAHAGEESDELLRLLRRHFTGAMEMQVQRLRPFVRRADAGEIVDLAVARAEIEALQVARGANLQQRVDEQFVDSGRKLYLANQEVKGGG